MGSTIDVVSRAFTVLDRNENDRLDPGELRDAVRARLDRNLDKRVSQRDLELAFGTDRAEHAREVKRLDDALEDFSEASSPKRSLMSRIWPTTIGKVLFFLFLPISLGGWLFDRIVTSVRRGLAEEKRQDALDTMQRTIERLSSQLPAPTMDNLGWSSGDKMLHMLNEGKPHVWSAARGFWDPLSALPHGRDYVLEAREIDTLLHESKRGGGAVGGAAQLVEQRLRELQRAFENAAADPTIDPRAQKMAVSEALLALGDLLLPERRRP